MKFKKYKSEFHNYKAIIEEDFPAVGWQIYVFENGKDVYDNVQNTLEISMEDAFEEFGIPLDSWEEVLE